MHAGRLSCFARTFTPGETAQAPPSSAKLPSKKIPASHLRDCGNSFTEILNILTAYHLLLFVFEPHLVSADELVAFASLVSIFWAVVLAESVTDVERVVFQAELEAVFEFVEVFEFQAEVVD